jgi:hypothetical protein
LVFGGFGSVVILYMPLRKNKKTIRRRFRRGGSINPQRPSQPKPSKLSFLGTRRTKRRFSLNKTRKRSPRSSSKSPRNSPRINILEKISMLNKELKNISIREKTYTELREYKKEIEELMKKCREKYGVQEDDTDSYCNVLIPYLQKINNKL